MKRPLIAVMIVLLVVPAIAAKAQWRDETMEAAKGEPPKQVDIEAVTASLDAFEERMARVGGAKPEPIPLADYMAAGEREYQRLGQQIAANLRAVQHDTKMLNGFVSSMESAQRASAAKCLGFATPKVKQSITGIEIVRKEHGSISAAYSRDQAVDLAGAVRRWSQDFEALLKSTSNLEVMTGKISPDLHNCLAAYNVPIL